jgi:hypothetical protein
VNEALAQSRHLVRLSKRIGRGDINAWRMAKRCEHERYTYISMFVNDSRLQLAWPLEPSLIVLDGYTSVFSRDHDGEVVHLYFTNAGLILLMVSLACAIVVNLLVSQ